ncbi:restriction endonuclease subunit S [Oceanisphaera ostreae]|uniref:Restriction endonuclease subunit S n=1 Tax=Oceanisphaera ostreae TaxID=914151 RepID=A0ABW3KIM1_9GAMM
MSDFVPEGWKIKTISEVCDIAIGGTPSRSVPEYWDSTKTSDNPWVSIRDLSQPLIFDTSEYITDAGVKRSNVKLVKKGTVLMSFKLSVGRVAFAGRDLYTNEAICAFLPKTDDALLNQYLYQGLQQWNLLENIDQAVKGVTLNKEKINKIEALLPPLPEQQKIASILSSVDEVIEKTCAQINKLKDLKTGMMQELLTKGIGSGGVPHTEFKDSPVGRIPAEWETVQFKDVFSDYKYGPRFSSNDYSQSGNVKTIRGTDLSSDGEVSYSQVPTASIDPKVVENHRLKDGDLIMITTAECGSSAVFREQQIPYIASAYAIKLSPTNKVSPEFIKYFMQTSIAISQIESFIRKGTVANLPGSDVMNIVLALPTLAEQNKIASILLALDARVSNVSHKVSYLTSLKKALMQDLLTGKVRVNVANVSAEQQEAVAG